MSDRNSRASDMVLTAAIAADLIAHSVVHRRRTLPTARTLNQRRAVKTFAVGVAIGASGVAVLWRVWG